MAIRAFAWKFDSDQTLDQIVSNWIRVPGEESPGRRAANQQGLRTQHGLASHYVYGGGASNFACKWASSRMRWCAPMRMSAGITRCRWRRLSYYFVMSLFPALIFLSAAVSYLPVPDLFDQSLIEADD
jgi:hypothetical protein